MAKTTFIAAGDAFVTKRLPKGGYEGFEEVQACVKAHDVAFINLESTFHNREGNPATVSGGTWAMSDPRTLDDIKEYGFNLFNTANNHSCDYSHGGVLATIRNLQERDMIFAGTGKDLGKRHPTLGDNVMIGAGAKVLGPFTIGDNSKIAAGAVVLKEIPEDATAVGVPARVVRHQGRRVSDDIDQVHIPDPVAQEIARLEARIKELEEKTKE